MAISTDDLYDKLVELYRKDHTIYYTGCPISSTHLCANWDLDIPESKFPEIMPCSRCSYSTQGEDCALLCNKRFNDLGLPNDIMVSIVGRNNSGFITAIEYEIGGLNYHIDIKTYEATGGKTVLELWRVLKCDVGVFVNLRTGKFIKINQDPIVQYAEYGKIYGYFSNNQYSFRGPYVELYNCDKPEWVCLQSYKDLD